MNKHFTKFNASSIAIHSLIFLLPVLVLTTKVGVGLCSFAFFFAAIFYRHKAMTALRSHFAEIRSVLLAFGIFLLLAIANAIFSPDGQLRDLEKPFRMLLAVAAMLTVLACRPKRKALWWGLIIGTFASAAFIIYQRWGMGIVRPGGLINSITFGDIVLCMGLMCMAATLDFSGRAIIWPSLGALAGLIASIATGTRGGWIALVLSMVLLLCYGDVLRGRWRKGLALLGAGVLISAVFIPQTGMRERIDQGVNDVQQYFNGEQRFTSVGTRLELWRTAWHLIERNPLVGAGETSVKQQVKQMVADGQSEAFVLEFAHYHNDILQQLVYGGLLGLLVWFSTLLMPFLFFLRQMRQPERAAPALAGMLLTLSYFSFGLTEVIFWSTRSAMFYALMVFILAGFCLTGRGASAAADLLRRGA